MDENPTQYASGQPIGNQQPQYQQPQYQQYQQPQYQQPPQQQSLMVSGAGEYHLKGISTWTKVLAVINSIMLLLIVILGVRMMAILPAAGLIYIVVALLILLFPILKLFGASSKLKAAVAFTDNDELENGLSNLRLLFTFYGVLSILGIIFMAIGVIGALMTYHHYSSAFGF